MRRLLLALIFVLAPTVACAQNVTVRDIIELSKAGLNEQALVALVEVNPTVFPVDVDTLKTLKAARVPDSVITAMIRSGRTQPVVQAPDPLAEPPVPADPPQTPQVVVIDHREEPQVREVAVPVYVAIPVHRAHRGVVPRTPVKPAEQVFWGWGGKLRPDAWRPSIEPQRDARIEIQKK
jgi:hypothetical protein